MIKVTKVICDLSFTYEKDGNTGTFTFGETYFARHSKKGSIIVKSNEGIWMVFDHSDKISAAYGRRTPLSGKFYKIDEMFFKNRKELKRMGI